MSEKNWLEELGELAYRFESLGFAPDIAAMDFSEKWGLYLFLRRLSESN